MKQYGLIGYPLGHSFSVGYFNEKFKAEHIDAEYLNFEIPAIDHFMEVVNDHPDLCGLNVTIPYKQQVIPFLDELDKTAAAIGAVNVIKLIRQPKGKIKLVGYNSDVIGFCQSIEPLLLSCKSYPCLGVGYRRCFEGCLLWIEESGLASDVCITYQAGEYPFLQRLVS